jgi:hypothetical protein
VPTGREGQAPPLKHLLQRPTASRSRTGGGTASLHPQPWTSSRASTTTPSRTPPPRKSTASRLGCDGPSPPAPLLPPPQGRDSSNPPSTRTPSSLTGGHSPPRVATCTSQAWTPSSRPNRRHRRRPCRHLHRWLNRHLRRNHDRGRPDATARSGAPARHPPPSCDVQPAACPEPIDGIFDQEPGTPTPRRRSRLPEQQELPAAAPGQEAARSTGGFRDVETPPTIRAERAAASAPTKPRRAEPRLACQGNPMKNSPGTCVAPSW